MSASELAAAPQSIWPEFVTASRHWVVDGVEEDFEGKVTDAASRLALEGLAELAGAHVLETLQDRMTKVHIPRWWEKQLSHGSDLNLAALQEVVGATSAGCRLLSTLAMALLAGWGPPPSQLLGMAGRFRRAVGAALLTTSPVGVADWLDNFYLGRLEQLSDAALACSTQLSSAFDSDQEEWEEAASWAGEHGGEEPGGVDVTALMGPDWVSDLRAVSHAFRSMALEEVTSNAFSAALGRHLRAFLLEKLARRFTRPCLPAALGYARSVPLKFLRLVLPEDGRTSMAYWGERLDYFVYETLCMLRTREMFDIVVDYPESLPAVEDLRECLQHTNLHRHFVDHFRCALEERLLLPGAATLDIIHQYVSTIKTLSQMDPTGSLLDAVGAPIKEYLRARLDTIRCIVSSLTEDPSDDPSAQSLSEELAKAVCDEEEEDERDDENDVAARMNILKWTPEPLEVKMRAPTPGARPVDIISMLVDIYGSKELFVNEYRAMLSDRLLAKTEYDITHEIRTLELLKLRFGESNLQNCEIMLKDMSDSKRLNANIRQMPATVRSPVRGRARNADLAPMSAIVISSLFWPLAPPSEEDIKLPDEVEDMLEAYAGRYFVLKAPRKLKWRKQDGSVELAVTVGDTVTNFNVMPVQATLLYQFQEKEEWTPEELARSVQVPVSAVRRRMMFWVNQGVITEVQSEGGTAVYRRASHMGGGHMGEGAAEAVKDEDDIMAPADSADNSDPGDMAVYEPYILGMLANHDAGMALERVHNMLKMFVSEPPYNRSEEQLAAGLARLIALEKVSVENGMYRTRM